MMHFHILPKEFIFLTAWLMNARGASINQPGGAFNITGNGVAGEGTFTISNGVAEVGLHMLLGKMAQKQAVVNAGDKAAPEVVIAGDKASTEVVIAGDKAATENSFKTTSQGDNSEMEVAFTKEDEDFLDQMLEEHNKLRSIHLSPPLKKNRTMSLDAKALAIQLAAEANLRHSDKASRPDEGENLAMGCTSSGPGITAKDAAKEWYDEVCSHNFFNQAYQDKSGHFSQLVWNATRELGVGKAMGTKFGMNCTFIVARYRPLGNIGSEFASDVSKGNFDSSYCSHVQRDTLPRLGVYKPKISSREYIYRSKKPHIQIL